MGRLGGKVRRGKTARVKLATRGPAVWFSTRFLRVWASYRTSPLCLGSASAFTTSLPPKLYGFNTSSRSDGFSYRSEISTMILRRLKRSASDRLIAMSGGSTLRATRLPVTT